MLAIEIRKALPAITFEVLDCRAYGHRKITSYAIDRELVERIVPVSPSL